VVAVGVDVSLFVAAIDGLAARYRQEDS